jgi:hypothetical protein
MKSTYSRRRFIGVLGGTAFATAAAFTNRYLGASAAVLQDATPSAGDPASELVLRVSIEGGFVPAEFLLTNIPGFSLYADGTAITTGPMIEIYPQPALPNLRQMKLTSAGMKRVLEEARAAGLGGGSRIYRNDMIADASTAVFILRDGAAETRVEAYALGLNDELIPDPAEVEARAKLLAFWTWLGSLSESLAPEEVSSPDAPYDIKRLRIFAREVESTTIDPNFEQEPVDWPLDQPLSTLGDVLTEGPLAMSTRCAEIAGNDVGKLLPALKGANVLTAWVSEEKPYQLWVRPLLPDEAGCPSG